MKVISTQHINVEDIINDLHSKAKINSFAACVIFIHAELDIQTIVDKLAISIPSIGCSVLSVYSGRSTDEATVSLWLVPEQFSPKVGLLSEIGDNTKYQFALSDHDPHIEALSKKYAFAGGMASDNWSFDKTCLFLNGQLIRNQTVVITMDASHGCAHGCGWLPIPETGAVITRSEGNHVFEIGNGTAVDFYKSFIPSAQAFGAYPLFLTEQGLYRAALHVNDNDGSIQFSGLMPVGEKVLATTTRRTSLMQNTHDIISDSLLDNHTPEIAVLVSCAARNLMLSDAPEYEHKSLMAVYRYTLSVYLYSEFIPQESGTTQLQNQHAVLSKIWR